MPYLSSSVSAGQTYKSRENDRESLYMQIPTLSQANRMQRAIEQMTLQEQVRRPPSPIQNCRLHAD